MSNPNQTTINKNIEIAELLRETHLVQMTTHASFLVDQENNKHFQLRMRSKRASIPRGSLQQQLKNWSKTITQEGTWMQWKEEAWWEMPMWIVVLTTFIFLCWLYFSPAPTSSQIKRQQSSNTTWQRLWVKLTFLHSALFFHKEFTDNMRHDQMKRQEITLLRCFCFPQQYWKNSSNKPESHFVQKSQHPQRMLVPQLTRPRSQFNAEQSNQMARHHPSLPLILFPSNINDVQQ